MSSPTPGDGLVAAYLLDGSGGARPLAWEEIRAWEPGQGVLWVHLDFTRPEARRWLRDDAGLDEITAGALTADETRPRTEVSPRGLLVLLRGVNTNPGQDPEDMVSIRLWLESRRVISCRMRRLLSVDDVRTSLHEGHGPTDPGSLLVRLARRLVARIGDVVGSIEDEVDALENEVLENEGRGARTRLSHMRRQIIELRRFLAPQREALARLLAERSPLLGEVSNLHLREVADLLTRYVEDLDSARDRAAVVQEELAARLAEQLNARLYLLAVVATVFLPLGFVTGLLGINVGGIPGSDDARGFGIVILILGVIALAEYLMLKWRRWF